MAVLESTPMFGPTWSASLLPVYRGHAWPAGCSGSRGQGHSGLVRV